ENGVRRYLWLDRLPGYGKTVLSIVILNYLRNIDNHITLDFFFNFNNIIKQILDGILCSLIFELYKLRINSLRELNSLFKSHRNSRDQPATNTLVINN
ncbi:hypothetical protein DER46DRAFT_512004, partial [Fusarium sp. MPI-SDFR-AT-0072]